MKEKITAPDYLLLLLYLDKQSKIKGSVRMMKMMFLFEKEIMPLIADKNEQIIDLPNFFAFNFGPFAKEIPEQIELFKSLDFIEVTDYEVKSSIDEYDDWDLIAEDIIDIDWYRKLNIDNKTVEYGLKDLGNKYVKEKILPQIENVKLDLLERFKKKIVAISSKQLLYYVYTKYPEYTTESKIKDKVLNEYCFIMKDDFLIKPEEDK